jgi:hypothetical protein
MQKQIKLIVADQFKIKKKAVKYEYPNEMLTEFEILEKEWWLEIDPQKSQEASLRDFCNLMMDKGIIEKHYYGKELLKQTINAKIPTNNLIKEAQFKQIMHKAYMRAALMNLYYFMR